MNHAPSNTKARFKRWIDAAEEILAGVGIVEHKQARSVVDQFSKTRSTVLVEVHADGFVEVFGDDHVQVMVINRPSASNNTNECKVDDLIDSILPKRVQDIRWPGPNVRRTGNIQPLTVEHVKQRIKELDLLYSIGDYPNKHFNNERTKQLGVIEA